MNLASWGSTGGWVPNSNIFISKKACTVFRTIFGNAWVTCRKAFNIPTDGCPIPKVIFKQQQEITILYITILVIDV